jgi:antitoxin (DNA-binding transcriptional repressor) of toxin-antitoxin stability system
MTTVADLKDLDSRTRDLVKMAAGGEEILITSGGSPVARIVAARATELKAGHAVVTEDFSLPKLHLGPPKTVPATGEIAEEMFDRK